MLAALGVTMSSTFSVEARLMPELDWTRFESLPGDQAANFELLWARAVRHTFARYGRFQARAQQPGVEFHLELDRDCPLGDAGQWLAGKRSGGPDFPAGRAIVSVESAT